MVGDIEENDTKRNVRLLHQNRSYSSLEDLVLSSINSNFSQAKRKRKEEGEGRLAESPLVSTLNLFWKDVVPNYDL